MHKRNNTSVLNGQLHSFLGDVTMYQRNNQQVLRGRHVTSYRDANNLVQVYNRLRMSNLTAFSKAVKRHFALFWEEKTPGRAYYHNFIAANRDARPHGLVVNKQHNDGAAVVSDYIVTQGSLPAIVVDTYSQGATHGITDIFVGDLAITPETTIGAFSRALVELNGDRFAYGDVLAFFCVCQLMPSGMPKVSTSSVIITLTDTAQYTFADVNLLGFGVTNKRLSIRGTAPVGGYTWVHSRTIPRTLRRLVSSQRLVMSDSTIFNLYASPEYMREAATLMNAVIPDKVSPAFLHHDPAVYEAFGVTCVNGVSFNTPSPVSTASSDSPIQQSVD